MNLIVNESYDIVPTWSVMRDYSKFSQCVSVWPNHIELIHIVAVFVYVCRMLC